MTTLIQCSDGEISLTDYQLHKLQQTPLFKEILTLDKAPHQLEFDVKIVTFNLILDYLCDNINPSESSSIHSMYELLECANYFQIESIIKICIDFFQQEFNNSCKHRDLQKASFIYSIGNTNVVQDKIYLGEAFSFSCEHGHLEIAKWIFSLNQKQYETDGIDAIYIIEELEEIFILSCSNGHLEVAKWLYTFGLKLANRRIYAGVNVNVFERSFCLSCQCGKLEVVQWLYLLNQPLNIQICDNFAFWVCCYYGQFDIAKWLYAIGGTGQYNSVYKMACHKGHMELVKLLYSQTWNTIINSDELIQGWQNSCSSGHLELAHWFYHKMGISIDNLTSYEYFPTICVNGHLDIAKWVYSIAREENFSGIDTRIRYQTRQSKSLEVIKWLCLFENIDIHLNHDEFFRLSCANGCLEIAQWLYCTYPDINIHALSEFAFTRSCEEGHLECAKWLYYLGHISGNKIDIHAGSGDIMTINDHAFSASCKRGFLNVAQWLYSLDDSFQVVINNIRYNNFNLDMVKWLHSNGNIYIRENAKSLFLSQICEIGNVEYAKWLYLSLNVCSEITDEEIRIEFINSCKTGAGAVSELSKWLYSLGRFDIHEIDMMIDFSYNVRKWLRTLRLESIRPTLSF